MEVNIVWFAHSVIYYKLLQTMSFSVKERKGVGELKKCKLKYNL